MVIADFARMLDERSMAGQPIVGIFTHMTYCDETAFSEADILTASERSLLP